MELTRKTTLPALVAVFCLSATPAWAVDESIEYLRAIQIEVQALQPVTAAIGELGPDADHRLAAGERAVREQVISSGGLEAFLEVLHEYHPGSFHLLKRLSGAQQQLVFDAYSRNEDMLMIRRLILEQLRISWMAPENI